MFVACRQNASPTERHYQNASFKSSLDLQEGGKESDRDAFAVAADGSPDRRLMTSHSDLPLLNSSPVLHGMDAFTRSDSFDTLHRCVTLKGSPEIFLTLRILAFASSHFLSPLRDSI